jgi:hypothetical protein
LTEEEQKKLKEHLATCESCRETLKQYESVVDQAIPFFVAKEASKDLDVGQDWSEDQQRQAAQVFFKRLEREPKRSTSTNEVSTPPVDFPYFPVNRLGVTCGCCMLQEFGSLSLLIFTPIGPAYTEALIPLRSLLLRSTRKANLR